MRHLVMTAVMLCWICDSSGAQVLSMREEAIVKRTIAGADPAREAIELFVWPAVVVMSGERTEGVFTVIADPVYRWFWWFFRDTTELASATLASLADDIERRFAAYPSGGAGHIFTYASRHQDSSRKGFLRL